MERNIEAAAWRERCNFCDTAFDRQTMRLVPVRCNVREFAGEVFHMWRCGTCRCLHCREIVDLDRYYAHYGTHGQRLDFFFRLFYREQLRRFRASGLKRRHRLLDYGCGAGIFVTYLQSLGYRNAVGYDPYGTAKGFGDASVLEAGAFDFICLQDVIEHVEEPRPLIEELVRLLRPRGALLVGMPSADEIDLNRPHKHLHHIHLPYHLHIYTRAALLRLASANGLEPIAFHPRFYAESPLFGMNEAFFRGYMERLDDTIDALMEPVRVGIFLRSPKLIFHGLFGYFYSPRHSITVVFRARP